MQHQLLVYSFIQLLYLNNSNSQENNIKYYSNDSGILSLMYHRFNENKYPSTNIRMDIFDQQMKILKNLVINFMIQNFLKKNLINLKKKKILITIDDGFKSFYNEAWPYLKRK